MAIKISFKNCLQRYFDTTFKNQIEQYVNDSSDFRFLYNLSEEENILITDNKIDSVKVIKTEGSVVTFFVGIKFSCSAGTNDIQDTVDAICQWNIPKKEDGLTIDNFGYGVQKPESECLYGDNLVPIVRKEEYGKMANLFLKKVFGDEVISGEGFLLAQSIVDKLKLQIFPCHLDNNCTGRIVMVDKELSFRDPNGVPGTKLFKKGTILIDLNRAALMTNNGSVIHSTLIHECVHWVFHRCAFELGRLYCVDDDGFICMKDNTTQGTTVANGNKFIEIQTLGIVPRILVPLPTICKEAKEIAREIQGSVRNKIEGYEMVLNELKNQHSETTESMKRSLISCGFDCFRGISVYQDGSYLRSYCFEKETLQKDETFDLPCSAMSELYRTNEVIRNLINSGEYVYADGHLIKNNPKYICFRSPIDPEPTEYALLNASECFLKFRVSYPEPEANVFLDYGLNRVSMSMKKTYEHIYNPNLPATVSSEARKEWEEHKKEWADCFRRTFGETLKEMMDHFNTRGTLFDGQGISADEVYRICKLKNRPRLETIVLLGVLMDMPYEIFIQFVGLAGYDFYANKPEILKFKEFMDDRSFYKDLDELEFSQKIVLYR